MRVPYSIILLAMLFVGGISGLIVGFLAEQAAVTPILVAFIAGIVSTATAGVAKFSLLRAVLGIAGYKGVTPHDLHVPSATITLAVVSGVIGGLAGYSIGASIIGTPSLPLIGFFSGVIANVVLAMAIHTFREVAS